MNVTYEKLTNLVGALTARLDGTLNALTADELWESASQRTDEGIRFVVFDLTKVTILTSAGIGVLVRLYTRLNDREGGLAIYGCNPRIREIITIVMLDKILNVCDTEDEAWEAIKQTLETAAT